MNKVTALIALGAIGFSGAVLAATTSMTKQTSPAITSDVVVAQSTENNGANGGGTGYGAGNGQNKGKVLPTTTPTEGSR